VLNWLAVCQELLDYLTGQAKNKQQCHRACHKSHCRPLATSPLLQWVCLHLEHGGIISLEQSQKPRQHKLVHAHLGPWLLGAISHHAWACIVGCTQHRNRTLVADPL
jgi:hypothetical protein